jgi:hypothetical protein
MARPPEISESVAYRFANKHQNSVLDSVVAKIGGNRQLAYDFIIEELEAAFGENVTLARFPSVNEKAD